MSWGGQKVWMKEVMGGIEATAEWGLLSSTRESCARAHDDVAADLFP